MGNELIKIRLNQEQRFKLSSEIRKAMRAGGVGPLDYDRLDLGFHLPINWPDDPVCEITLAQLTVIARKLGMDLVIDDIRLLMPKVKSRDQTRSRPACSGPVRSGNFADGLTEIIRN